MISETISYMKKNWKKACLWLIATILILVQIVLQPKQQYFTYLMLFSYFWIAIFGATDIITIFLNFLNYRDDDDGIENAGAWIGVLERMLILIFLLSGFYSGIPTVLVIKGFARYKKIAEDSKFAERFTVGTMLSLLLVVICAMLIHRVIVVSDMRFFEYLLSIKIS